MGCRRFSIESKQPLVHFYSEDSLRCNPNSETKRKKSYGVLQKKTIPVITERIQQLLWDGPHSISRENIPGKLSLCIGMPIMIRNNNATELCITKGQEATVYGWQTEKGSRGQQMLDTLFVKLSNPPYTVKFDGLAENVVPLTRSTVVTTCQLPDDTSLTIS